MEENVVEQPEEQLHKLANKWNIDFYSKEFALKLDQSNLWPTYRDRFYYPKIIDLPKGNKKLNDLIKTKYHYFPFF
jgi:hypothetical protein